MLHERGTNELDWLVLNPKGQHAVAVGIDAPIHVEIKGSVGYYCAGMNKDGDDRRRRQRRAGRRART